MTMEGTKGSAAAAQVIEAAALLLTMAVAFSIRLFSIVKYESVIHEFDPYFNYRVTQYAVDHGVTNFWDFFDDKTWYPLGRVVGGTLYPGLTLTATGLYWLIKWVFRLWPVPVKDVCVMIGPFFAALTALFTYLLVREVRGRGAGLMAATLVASIPSYISRSIAGSYDNEAVAITALVATFYFYLRSIKTGSLLWGVWASLSYGYMVSSWGGYTFIINLIPIHALALLITNRFTRGLYVGYSQFVINGTLLALNLPVVGFNAVQTSEHFSGFFVLGLLNIVALVRFLKANLTPQAYAKAFRLFVTFCVVGMGLATLAIITYAMTSPTFRWSGRSLSLLDPTYASKYIPIIASVSEHQAPAWNSFVNDLRTAAILLVAGIISCFRPMTEASLFLVIWAVTSCYFTGVMTRLMLVLAPVASCLAGIALSDLLALFARSYQSQAAQSDAHEGEEEGGKKAKKKAKRRAGGQEGAGASSYGYLNANVSFLGMAFMVIALSFHLFHCSFLGGEGYSSPSIILQSRTRTGGLYIFDDYREAYAWMRENTQPDAKIASWWDYGYQTSAMADRTVLVDNNTWNNTHIATVGRAMALPEKQAWEVFRSLDVDYVFVVFGGLVGYSSDDINKFLWMVRIGGGVYPDIKERDYLGNQGYRIDDTASPAMLNSLMYKLSYYQFMDQVGIEGEDRVRGSRPGNIDPQLKYFQEAYTTEHWMLRVYKVLDKPSRSKIGVPQSLLKT